VEDNLAQAEKQEEDHQSNNFPDMHISSPRSDAVTGLNYIRENDLNPSVAYDLEILQMYCKGKNVGASVPQVYIYSCCCGWFSELFF